MRGVEAKEGEFFIFRKGNFSGIRDDLQFPAALFLDFPDFISKLGFAVFQNPGQPEFLFSFRFFKKAVSRYQGSDPFPRRRNIRNFRISA